MFNKIIAFFHSYRFFKLNHKIVPEISSISSYIAGKSAEKTAVDYLKQEKWKIIKKNFKTQVGEIDIIASKANFIVAFEVKYRKDRHNLPYVISARQQYRIAKAFSYFLQYHSQFTSLNQRFDVIFVNKDYEINHIENAW